MKLEYTSILYRDRQAEAPIAYCPKCLGEIYRSDISACSGAKLYHAGCLEKISRHIAETGGTKDEYRENM